LVFGEQHSAQNQFVLKLDLPRVRYKRVKQQRAESARSCFSLDFKAKRSKRPGDSGGRRDPAVKHLHSLDPLGVNFVFGLNSQLL